MGRFKAKDGDEMTEAKKLAFEADCLCTESLKAGDTVIGVSRKGKYMFVQQDGGFIRVRADRVHGFLKEVAEVWDTLRPTTVGRE